MRIVEVAISGTIGTHRMGPVSSSILELANRFAECGHSVTICDVASQQPRVLLHPAVRLIELAGVPEGRVVPGRNAFASLVATVRNYHRFVRDAHARADVRAAHVVHFHSPLAAFVAAHVYRMNVFYTAHTPVWCLATNQRRALSTIVAGWLERRVIRRARMTAALGPYLGSAVPNADIVTIQNGIDVAHWQPMDRLLAREALGIDPRSFVVLFAGRIRAIKGVDLLLDALHHLKSELPRLEALVVGPLSGTIDMGDDHIEAYAQAMLVRARGLPVKFIGYVNNRDPRFRQHVAAADIVVVPSRAEPQGLVVLEALAMGIPVIASATGGIPAMLPPEVGYLCAPGDSGALATCIRHAYENPSELAQKSAVARGYVERCHSWEAAADRYLREFAMRTSACGTAAPPGGSRPVTGE